MRIQHNIMAMNAYRNYNNNTKALSGNLEKLSSGYKINRAGDDAAGLAISEKMRAQITGLDAAQKNVKDGISLVKTAEGAMQEIQDMLNRMDYLATQSANGTYDNEVDRANLQKEVDALKSEINRIADSANFNGIKLLDGSLAAEDNTTGISGTGKATADGVFTIVADGQLGVEPQAGEFEYDLSQLSIDLKVEDDGTITAKSGRAGKTRAAGASGTTPSTGGATGPGATGSTGGATGPGATGSTGGATGPGATGSTGGTTGPGNTGAVSGSTVAVSFSIGGLNIRLTVDEVNEILGENMEKGKTYTISGDKMNKFVSKFADKLNTAMTTAAAGSAGATPSTAAAGKMGRAGNAATAVGAWGSGGKLAGSKVTVSDNGKGVLTVKMDSAPTQPWGNIDMTLRFSNGTTGNGGEQFAPTVIKEPVDNTQKRQYAEAKLDLTKMDIKDGTTLKIGNSTYTFAVGSDSKFKSSSNVVDLTNVTATGDDLAKIAANRLSEVAKNNKQFIVGSTTQGVVSLTEREGGIDYTKNNLAGKDNKGTQGTDTANNGTSTNRDATVDDWAGLISFGQATKAGGLTLQIGDTADSFNQMSVVVGDMHTKAMGIADIDISSQEGAADAIATIKDAINYVSGVRGDLGAVQNRLEHTGNNLSVMAENIQDAESTIRDTDVASEMMSYVKNNILVQSAQAMLAQANQVPQGVLQLLG